MDGADGVLAMITVYLDESGTHDNSPIVVVSASFARPKVWRAWAEDWNKQKSPIRIFHAVDAHNRDGEFEGWAREDRDELVKRILPIIPKHGIDAVISGIDLNALREHLSDRPDVLEKFGAPYLACLHWLIPSVCEKAAALGERRIAFIHEENSFQKEALWVLSFLRRRGLMGDLSAIFRFGGKKDYPPLQCADVIAYEANKQLRQIDGPMRKPWLVMDPNQKFMFKGFDRNSAKELASGLIREFDELGRRNID
ncbi:MAG: DUF3800 domain-containing protein [Roseibium sp.]|nr:DUF3800 domain-containing protein [Roseibium sp.]